MVSMFRDTGSTMTCCGEPMEEVKANTTDASLEKHVPVIEMDGDKVSVRVGSAPHPMTEEHKIVWIYLQTEKGEQLNCIDTQDTPDTCFRICSGDKVLAAFAYCNLHGLWKADYK
jgi:superoxide reductase